VAQSGGYRTFFQQFKQSKQPVGARYTVREEETRKSEREDSKKRENNKSFTMSSFGERKGAELKQGLRGQGSGHNQSYSSNQGSKTPIMAGRNQEVGGIGKSKAAAVLKKISGSGGGSDFKKKENNENAGHNSTRYNPTRFKQGGSFFHFQVF
jgi:hypothetical protein